MKKYIVIQIVDGEASICSSLYAEDWFKARDNFLLELYDTYSEDFDEEDRLTDPQEKLDFMRFSTDEHYSFQEYDAVMKLISD
jgi:hypothetical protein